MSRRTCLGKIGGAAVGAVVAILTGLSLLAENSHAGVGYTDKEVVDLLNTIQKYNNSRFTVKVMEGKLSGDPKNADHLGLLVEDKATTRQQNMFYMGPKSEKSGLFQLNGHTFGLYSPKYTPLEFLLNDKQYRGKIMLFGDGFSLAKSTHPVGSIKGIDWG